MVKWLYTHGVQSERSKPFDIHRVDEAARLMKRKVRYIDMYSFQREIIAATPIIEGRPLAYVESQARQQDERAEVEVSFHLLILDKDGSVTGSELESKNPYFGCEVGYLEWHGNSVILIYCVKGRTYACSIKVGHLAYFVPISDDWIVYDDMVIHRRFGETSIRRLSLPGLTELPSLSSEVAIMAGIPVHALDR